MESLSYHQLQIAEDLLEQIHHAILDLKEWNKEVENLEAVEYFLKNLYDLVEWEEDK